MLRSPRCPRRRYAARLADAHVSLLFAGRGRPKLTPRSEHKPADSTRQVFVCESARNRLRDKNNWRYGLLKSPARESSSDPRPVRYIGPRQNLGLGRLSGILRPLLGSERDVFHQNFGGTFCRTCQLQRAAFPRGCQLPSATMISRLVSSIDVIWQKSKSSGLMCQPIDASEWAAQPRRPVVAGIAGCEVRRNSPASFLESGRGQNLPSALGQNHRHF